MKFFLNISITLFILLNSSSIFSQTLSPEEKEILELQDKRILGENEILLSYLESEDPDVVFKALYALANIADSTSVYKTSQFLDGLYKNKNTSGLLDAYAFYLGQTNGADSREKLSLMTYSTNENVYKSFPELVNALAKTGDESDMNYMINITASDRKGEKFRTEVYRALAMSIARFALRRIRNETSVEALKQMANNEDSLIHRNIAFALWRTGDKKLLDTAKQEIYYLTQSADAQTRMWAVNAAGKLQDKMLLMFMLESFGSEKDWRVKVNMLNSLTNYDLDSLTELTPQLYSIFGDAIGGEDEHVSLTALNVLGKLFADVRNSSNSEASSLADDIKKEIRYGLDSVDEISWRQKSELANTMSLIFEDEAKEDLFRAFSGTDDYNLKAGIVKAFGNFDNGMIYREVRDTLTAEVKRYNEKNPATTGELVGSEDLAKLYRGFVEMLSNLDEKVDEENQNTIRLIFTEFVSSKDPVITDICLSALKDSLYSKYNDETASVIAFDYGELSYPEDYDVMLIFIDAMKDLNNKSTKAILENNLLSENYEIAKASADALEKISGNKQEFTAKPRYDFDWNYIESLSQKRFITVKTNKGNIKIELMPEVAPFTVMNFLKLAENNFYDGTIFHRVVSNFVIQGGDPTGTGYGSPGYTIRSEFSPLTYETGMVGMASSGKDTEGSQFFITHSATPHLDGRYTIFGKVTEGMDVVDEIMIGDFIEDVVID